MTESNLPNSDSKLTDKSASIEDLTAKQLKEHIETTTKSIDEEKDKIADIDNFLNMRWLFKKNDSPINDSPINLGDTPWKFIWGFVAVVVTIAICLSVYSAISSHVNRNYKENIYQAKPNEVLYFQYVNEDDEGRPNYSQMTTSQKVKVLSYLMAQSLYTTTELSGFDNVNNPTAGTCQGLFKSNQSQSADGNTDRDDINQRAETYNNYIKQIKANPSNVRNFQFTGATGTLESTRDITSFKEILSSELTLTADNQTEIPKCVNLVNLLLALKLNLFNNVNATEDTQLLIVEKLLATYQHIQKNDPNIFIYTGLSKNLNKEMELMENILGEEHIFTTKIYSGTLSESNDLCNIYIEDGIFFNSSNMQTCANDNLTSFVLPVFQQNPSQVFQSLSAFEQQQCFNLGKCVNVSSRLTKTGLWILWLSIIFSLLVCIILFTLTYKQWLNSKVQTYNLAQKNIKELEEAKQVYQDKLDTMKSSIKEELEKIKESNNTLKDNKKIELRSIEERIKAVQPDNNNSE